MSELQPEQILDLRLTPCPLNFVKAKLALEKLPTGAILELWLAVESLSVLNVPNSLRQEGHGIILQEQREVEDPTGSESHKGSYIQLWVQKSTP